MTSPHHLGYPKPKKRLIVCADGTWQKLQSPYPTNVVKIAQAIKPSDQDGIPQIVFYSEGVGSGNTATKLFAQVDRILGGACGIGIDNNIEAAYRFLSLNYEPGDEIYLFGFSRGAYTVRSLAGLIRCSGGLLSLPTMREAPFAYELYQDRTLTLKEKEAFRKLPIPYAYLPNVAEIKQCRAEALRIYRDRSIFKTVTAAMNAEKEKQEQAKIDLERKQEEVKQLLQKYGLSERKDDQIRQQANITLLACWDTVGSLGVPNSIPLIGKWINEKYRFHDPKLSSIVENALHAMAIDETRKVFDVTQMEREQHDQRPLHQVWFPGGHGCVGGGSQAERGLSDRALAWMMEQIKALNLGLKFNQTAVEDGIHPDYKGHISPYSVFYKLLGVIKRDLGNSPSIDNSAKERWNHCFTYRPTNLQQYAKKHGWYPPFPVAQNENPISLFLHRILGHLGFDYLEKEYAQHSDAKLSDFPSPKET